MLVQAQLMQNGSVDVAKVIRTFDGAQADGASMGDYALYAVAGTGLLAGMFALGKGFSKKG